MSILFNKNREMKLLKVRIAHFICIFFCCILPETIHAQAGIRLGTSISILAIDLMLPKPWPMYSQVFHITRSASFLIQNFMSARMKLTLLCGKHGNTSAMALVTSSRSLRSKWTFQIRFRSAEPSKSTFLGG